MIRSARSRLQDPRDIHQLVGERREPGDSAAAWRSHLLDGAMRQAGAGIGLESELTWKSYDKDPETRDLVGAVDRGLDGGFNRVAFEETMRECVT